MLRLICILHGGRGDKIGKNGSYCYNKPKTVLIYELE
jgi:hypothetical protein